MPRVKEFNETDALDKALDLFWQKGYYATSAQDLVNGLNLSRSSIYSTFTDKRSLFIKALQRYSQLYIDKVLTEVERTDDIPKTITKFFNDIIDQDDAKSISKGCFIVNTGIELAAHDVEIEEIVNQYHSSVVTVLEGAIKKGQRLGQISATHNAKTLARFILNSVSGLRVAVRSNQDDKELKDVISLCLSVLDS